MRRITTFLAIALAISAVHHTALAQGALPRAERPLNFDLVSYTGEPQTMRLYFHDAIIGHRSDEYFRAGNIIVRRRDATPLLREIVRSGVFVPFQSLRIDMSIITVTRYPDEVGDTTENDVLQLADLVARQSGYAQANLKQRLKEEVPGELPWLKKQ